MGGSRGMSDVSIGTIVLAMGVIVLSTGSTTEVAIGVIVLEIVATLSMGEIGVIGEIGPRMGSIGSTG